MGNLFIRNGLLIDGYSDEPRPVKGIVIENGFIKEVCENTVPEISKLGSIDATGCVILPGLIDSHVHLVWSGSDTPTLENKGETESFIALKALSVAQKFLRQGVTTVRDTASAGTTVMSLSKAINYGYVKGPRVISCGPAICMTGGHCWDSIGLEADGADATRSTARKLLREGVDFLKVMATGGMYSEGEDPGATQYNVDEMRAVVEEGHKVFKRTAAHAEGLEGIRNSIKAGVDSIEHGIYADEECLREMAEKGIYLVPTMIAFKAYAEGDGVLPPSLVAKGKRVIKQHFAMLQNAIALNVKIATGTDCGGRNKPPHVYFEELKIMNKAGMSKMDVIKASSSVAAECLALNNVGKIKPGYAADILIAKNNPLNDLNYLKDLKYVIQAGKIIT